MRRAWVMLKRSRGQGRNFWAAEKRLHEWTDSRSMPFVLGIGVFGEFDFLLLCEADDSASISAKVRQIARELADEVTSATTYLATDVQDATRLTPPPEKDRLHCVMVRTLPGTGEDTREALERMGKTLGTDAETAGCKLLAVDTVFGDYDVMMLFSGPYESANAVLGRAGSTIPTIRKTTAMLGTGFRV